jgi:hypothetical protein
VASPGIERETHEPPVLGMAKNQRLQRIIGAELHQARQQFEQTQQATRVFKDFSYRTHKSWSRQRRVIGKAEHLDKGPNPRFVVTSLTPEAFAAQTVYEQEYCGRGNMENRIKEKKLFLFADRVSCATMRANQIRLCLSTVAYILLRALRQFGLAQTEIAQAQCDTIRVKLLKIGTVVTVSERAMPSTLSLPTFFASSSCRRWSSRPVAAFHTRTPSPLAAAR